MCVISSSLLATGLASLGSVGTSIAGSTAGMVVATSAVNTAVGAALSAGVSAAMGARGSDIGKAALIGGASAGALSGAGMALEGITTVQPVVGSGKQVISNSGGLLGTPSTSVIGNGGNVLTTVGNTTYTTMNDTLMVSEGVGDNAHWVAASAEQTKEFQAVKGAGFLASMGKYGVAALQGAGGAVEAYGYHEEAKENAANLKAQAKNAEIQANQQVEVAEIEARDLARKQRQAIGQGKVAAAANGVMLESRAESAPAMWEQDMMAEAAWDREKLLYNANIRADALRAQASIYRAQASNLRSSGNLKSASALIKGGIGAGLSLYGNPSSTLFT